MEQVSDRSRVRQRTHRLRICVRLPTARYRQWGRAVPLTLPTLDTLHLPPEERPRWELRRSRLQAAISLGRALGGYVTADETALAEVERHLT